MPWYREAVFYHIYPLGLLGAPKQNDGGETVHRLRELWPWVDHIRALGCAGLYIGPLFESVGHGYETTDYFRVDRRLGDNEDLKSLVAYCHENGIRVILDGVFNHTGREFFAFRDIKEHRENSVYKDWYAGVNFWGNNSYNDGFSYQNWGGYDLLAKLNHGHWAVGDHLMQAVRFWVSEFDIDGLRLDAADVLSFDFMRRLRRETAALKPDFYLMGEVIHGEYSRWVNEETLHAVTNYHLHKALYSGHNDHNYFEIAHTVKRLYGMGGNRPDGLSLYNFTDNHDVERIHTKLRNKAHYAPVHILMYTLPGVPSVYYGSEFGIEGRKERGSDDSLRPALRLSSFAGALTENPCTALIAALGRIRRSEPALSYGDYRELSLTTTAYAFSRNLNGRDVLIAVNNGDGEAFFDLPCSASVCTGALYGGTYTAENGRLRFTIPANGGEILLPGEIPAAEIPVIPVAPAAKPSEPAAPAPDAGLAPVADGTPPRSGPASAPEMAAPASAAPLAPSPEELSPEVTERDPWPLPPDKPYEQMTVAELQSVVYHKMKRNGPVTPRMEEDIRNNIWQNSLINWAKSFR